MATSDTLPSRPATSHLTRSGALGHGSSPRPSGPSTPRTPALGRSLSSRYASPGSGSSYTIDEEVVVYAFGSRSLNVGLAGESDPRGTIRFGPRHCGRAGRYGMAAEMPTPAYHAHDWELWSLDIRGQNMDLIQDRLERALRHVQSEVLLLDFKGRKAVMSIPTSLPDPLVELKVRAVFESAQQPATITLLSDSISSMIATSLRSALVIDIGWHETTVSAIYEYRHVSQYKTRRAGRSMHEAVEKLLNATAGVAAEGVTFENTEQVVTRLAWCRATAVNDQSADKSPSMVTCNLAPLSAVSVSRVQLAEVVESTLFDSTEQDRTDDDDTQPLHILAWRCLSRLPIDVRGACIPRVVITGGVSNIPGVKTRLLSSLRNLIKDRGWNLVEDYGSIVGDRRTKPKISLERHLPDQSQSPTVETDPITERLERRSLFGKKNVQPIEVRGIETLGAWAGASLFAWLHVQGSIEIKRDDFLRHGLGSTARHL